MKLCCIPTEQLKCVSILDSKSRAALCRLRLSEGKGTPLPSIFGWVSRQMSIIYGQDIQFGTQYLPRQKFF